MKKQIIFYISIILVVVAQAYLIDYITKDYILSEKTTTRISVVTALLDLLIIMIGDNHILNKK